MRTAEHRVYAAAYVKLVGTNGINLLLAQRIQDLLQRRDCAVSTKVETVEWLRLAQLPRAIITRPFSQSVKQRASGYAGSRTA